jgi:hypothetical protein
LNDSTADCVQVIELFGATAVKQHHPMMTVPESQSLF